MRVSVWKTGLVIGLGIGLWHLCWAVLVAFGAAELVTNFILQSHFVALDVRIQPFDAAVGALLVGFTTVLGFVIGAIFAMTWNLVHPHIVGARA